MSGRTSWIGNTLTGLCLFFGLTALPTSLSAQSGTPPPPETITDRQGLPQAFVPAIVQDRRGFIWMATLDGLARYDGRHFKVFQPTASGQPGLSSAGIENLLTDQRGMIWIKTYQGDLDRFDPLRETFVNVTRQPGYLRSVGRDTLESYYPDRQNRLWVWLRNKGLVCFGLTNNRVRRYRHEPGKSTSLSSNVVTAVVEDGRGQIWVATAAGLDRLDERTGNVVHYRHLAPDSTSIPDEVIRVLHRRQNGDLLLVSERHLTLLDHRSGRMQRVALPAPTFQWWKHHIATDSQGNDYLDWAGQILRISRRSAGPALTLQPLLAPAPDWRSMGLFVDRSDVLWVGTDATGVRKFNLRANLFASQPYRRSFPVDVLTNALNVSPDQVARLALGPVSYNFRATVDGAGRFWFTVGSTPFYRLDRQTGKITAVPFPARFRELGSDRPALLATDPGGRVWAVHDSLVGWYDEPTGRWQRFPFSIRRTTPSTPPLAGPVGPTPTGGVGFRRAAPLPSVRPASGGVPVESPILQVVVDGRALWLMTAARGLYRVDRQTGQIRRYAHQPGDSTSLSSNNLYCLFADPLDANTLWVGTAGAGVCRFDKRSGRCQRFTTKNGLPNNVIYAAIPDRRGYVWIATNRGLCRLDRRTGQTRTYTREDGLSADEFNRFHSFYLPGPRSARHSGDDRIILGGIEGITLFTPGQLQEDTYQPMVELTGLWLNNRPVEPGPHSPLGNGPVQMARHLTLPHDQNFLTVAFAGLQFNNPGRLRYRYRLEGIDRGWTLTDQPQAIYTDLSPGAYTLRLNASNTSGQWSQHVRTLAVTITPPWWASWWAYGLYVAVAGGLVLAGGRSYLRQREARHQRTVAEMKERFFANITHEFRTPLTLLLGPAERIIAESEQAGVRQQGELIQRHGRQLLGLINQLLDLAKLESATLRVEESRGDLAGFVAAQVGLFGPDAGRQHIRLTLHNTLPEPGEYWFDHDKLTAILTNLVGNALKFTPAGGTIDVSLFCPADGWVKLVVRDSGVGIAPDQLPHIFERFYQAGDPAPPPAFRASLGRAEAEELLGKQRPVGTGIGLALVKELVGLQGGTITVESAPADNGATRRGTTFTLTLPYRRATTPRESDSTTPAPDPPTQAEPRLANGADAPVVLVVEDNDDLAAFIADCLPRTYQIHRAADGLDGLEQARERVPDLIISDVMMPGMDGYELCRRLKADPLTNHVPVMLLTAKAALDSRLEGLRGGADDYLTKPFHVAELQLRVGNLLTTQRRLGEKLRTEFQSPVAASPAEPVHPFLTTLYGVLDRHLDDATFGSEELAQQANLSRMQLYRKLKALAGLPATEFIRGYRLKQSVALLQGGMPVAQAAYAVGFESPSYFSQCFREQFGEPPSRFIARSA